MSEPEEQGDDDQGPTAPVQGDGGSDQDNSKAGDEASFPLVAVGASAGGVQAVGDLLDGLPADPGVAIVVIMHGKRGEESYLPDVLRTHTSMPLVVIEDGLAPEIDHVYLCPSDDYVTLNEGRFRITEREENRSKPTRTIDRLFRSMAEDQGSRVVGVVLSGALSDGTLGLRDIHAHGGITLAQEEATAEYPDMPGSAIAAGHVDIVLPPEGLAREIERIGRDLDTTQPGAGVDLEHRFDSSTLNRIFSLVEDRTGVDFSEYRRSTLLRRIERRMLAVGISDPEAYLEHLSTDPDEAAQLRDESLIHVTRFFREPEIYDALREDVFPALIERAREDRPIRVWVPGCATGEEVYSMAIALDECLLDQGANPAIQLFGTDLSEEAVAIARKGTYPKSITEDVSDDRLQRYFIDDQGTYRIRESIRNRCVFAQQDLVRDPPFSDIDLVSCRNVLIYLEPQLQERVAATLHYALAPDGILVLGSAESTERFQRLFEPMDVEANAYRKLDVETSDLLSRGPRIGPAATERPPDPGRHGSRSQVDLRRQADEAALDRYAPPGVVVDEDFEVLQFRGDVRGFLAPVEGQASLNFMRLAPHGLAMAARKLVEQASRNTSETKRAGLQFEVGGEQRTVDLRVLPLPEQGSRGARAYLVSFEPHQEHRSGGRTLSTPKLLEPRGVLSRVFDLLGGSEADELRDRLENTQAELQATRENLQSVVEEYEATTEELRSANEEALSTNEELQSTNEELETAKEELQSTNEELSTLNEELRERNEELQRVNDDLVNLLNSVDLPIVMVGPDLRIRRFTPQAEDMLNLIDGDVGRPLVDLNLPFEGLDLEQLILDVLGSLQVKTQTVAGEQGGTFELRIHPYRTQDNKIDGAVLVFWDLEQP